MNRIVEQTCSVLVKHCIFLPFVSDPHETTGHKKIQVVGGAKKTLLFIVCITSVKVEKHWHETNKAIDCWESFFLVSPLPWSQSKSVGSGMWQAGNRVPKKLLNSDRVKHRLQKSQSKPVGRSKHRAVTCKLRKARIAIKFQVATRVLYFQDKNWF